MQSYTEFWTYLFTWNAKADRSQYWIPVIVNYLLGGMILAIIEKMSGHPIDHIYNWTDESFALMTRIVIFLDWIGSFTVKARRLHDTDRSAWWILIELIPVIGTIWFFILMILPGVKNSRWGKNQTQV